MKADQRAATTVAQRVVQLVVLLVAKRAGRTVDKMAGNLAVPMAWT